MKPRSTCGLCYCEQTLDERNSSSSHCPLVDVTEKVYYHAKIVNAPYMFATIPQNLSHIYMVAIYPFVSYSASTRLTRHHSRSPKMPFSSPTTSQDARIALLFCAKWSDPLMPQPAMQLPPHLLCDLSTASSAFRYIGRMNCSK